MTHPHNPTHHPIPQQPVVDYATDPQQQQQQQQQQQSPWATNSTTPYGYQQQPQALPPGAASSDHLCSCGGDIACCLASCFFPSIAYGYNYSLARQEPVGACCCPCLANTALDCVPYAVYSIVMSALHMTPWFATAPLGCICRAQHRIALFGAPEQHSDHIIQQSEKEHWLESVAIETLCWGCSLAQIHGRLARRRMLRSAPAIAGNDLIGTLHMPPLAANSMTQPLYNNNGLDAYGQPLQQPAGTNADPYYY